MLLLLLLSAAVALPAVHDSASFSISVFPTVFADGQDATVTYDNVPNPDSKDYIGVSCGPVNDPLDFIFTIDVPTDSDSGSVVFENLIFMRCDYTFAYVSDADDEVLGTVTAQSVDSVGTPKQGHIAINDNNDEMVVSYVSGKSSFPSVRFGLSESSLTMIVTGNSTTYSADQFCNSPANLTNQVNFRNPGFMHTVVLQNLAPSTQYFYQFGNANDGWSQTYQFTSRPAVGANVNFIAYADMGTTAQPAASGTATNVYHDITTSAFSFLLHPGDISYADGEGWQWESFMTLISPYATQIPYMIGMGNHDYDYEVGNIRNDPSHQGFPFQPSWGNYEKGKSGGECSVVAVHRFAGPENGNGLFWYSFIQGNIKVIQLSTEHDFVANSPQYDWFLNELKSVNRRQTPWVVLSLHRYLYSTQADMSKSDTSISQYLREYLEPLIYQYGVNLVIQGHQHSYERSCPLYQEECQDQGPVYVTVGTGGTGLETTGFDDSLGDWSIMQTESWGYCRFYATATEITGEFIINEDASIFDTFTIQPWTGSKIATSA